MEKKLIDAAIEGNIGALRVLLSEDPLVLDRVSYYNSACGHKTPLHIAAMQGHVAFVKYIVNENPQLATQLDSTENSSPLHMAAAAGHVDVVKALLFALPHRMCFACDRQGRNPLHVAAMNGRVEVLKALMDMAPLAAQEKLASQQTVLHFCVKHRQLESLKVLMPELPEMVNEQDDDGNALLHLAVRDRQFETIEYLLSTRSVRDGMNLENRNGMTPLDILVLSQKDMTTNQASRDNEIKKSLKRAGATFGKTIKIVSTSSCIQGGCFSRKRKNSNRILVKKKKKGLVMKSDSNSKSPKDWLDKKRSALMVVASLMATVTFQVGMNPPGGVWQDDKRDKNGTLIYSAGTSVYGTNHAEGYGNFLIANTIGFIASMSIILLLMSGLPLRRRVFMWILMLITWVALSAIALTFAASLFALTPASEKKQKNRLYTVVEMTTIVWVMLMAILFLGHTFRFLVKTFKCIKKAITKTILMDSSCATSSPTSSTVNSDVV